MQLAPLVSIVVISHNYERFLAEALESALAQTYSNCEVIVIDDGSTDDSVEVAQRYADRARLIAQTNAGVERAGNRAAREAKGDYLVRLDADDVLEPTYVEELLRALRRSPDAAYAYCRARVFGAVTKQPYCMPFSAYVLTRRTNYIHTSALVARDDFLRVGGYSEDLGEHAHEDWDLWLKLLAAGRRGTYVRKRLVRWRRHPGGSRNPESGQRMKNAIAFIRARHADLGRRTGDWRGRAFYALDLAIAAVDALVGFSRWPSALQAVERASWQRFRRWHAPPSAGAAASADSDRAGGA
jgi:glycosyltransferase involved in cell wall biosynthesis